MWYNTKRGAWLGVASSQSPYSSSGGPSIFNGGCEDDVMEEWRDVVGSSGIYQISSLGRVRSKTRTIMRSDGKPYKRRGQIMKAVKCREGYMKCGLRIEGIYVNKLVHRMVAESFLNPDKLDRFNVVDHIDGVKTNNNLENLQVITASENVLKGKTSKLNTDKISTYPYVTYDKNTKGRKKWQAQINRNGRWVKKRAETEKEAYDLSLQLLGELELGLR